MNAMGIQKRSVGIIGLGHVGAHCAYSLLVQGIVDELILVDMNEKKAISECQDLNDSLAYMPHNCKIRVGSYEDLKDCDILVNSVGQIEMIASGDRVLEMEFTIAAVNSYVKKVVDAGFHGIWINITNPCDIVTRQVALLSGLPKGHVFGTGTGLDTARLKTVLAGLTDYDHKSINGFVLGEHGRKQMVPWSNVSFGGKSLDSMAASDEKFRFDREKAKNMVHDNAWVTYNGKHCTEYGICSTLARMVSIIFHDERAIVPASMLLDGEYGEHDIYVGVPVLLSANGVEKVIELDLTPEEDDEFIACCEGVRQNMEDGRKRGIEIL